MQVSGQLEDCDRITVRIRHLEVATCGDCDILFAVHLVGDGRSVDPGAEVITPDAITGPGVEGVEPAVAFAHEDQVAGRCQSAADQWLWRGVLPRDLPCLDVQCDKWAILNPVFRHIRERAAETNETGALAAGLVVKRINWFIARM